MTIAATFSNQACGICGSSMFAITPLGFTVCRKCGCEQEAENLSQSLGKKEFTEQGVPSGHAILGIASKRTLGLTKERVNRKFQRLQNVDTYIQRDYKQNVQVTAYKEIMRITGAIGLSQTVAEKISAYFMGIYEKTTARKLEHSLSVLVPVVIYRCATIFNYTVNLKSILTHIKCTPRQFNKVLVSTYTLFTVGNKYELIMESIRGIASKMHMPEKVFLRAIEILHASTKMSNTTIGVAAASCLAVAVLSLKMKKAYPIYEIADAIHVAASAVGNKIAEVFSSKSAPKSIPELSSIIPKIYGKVLLNSKKTAKITKVEKNILGRIMCVADALNMRPEVRGRAIRILRTNFGQLGMTTPEVAAGACLSLSVFSLQLRTQYRMLKIAKQLGSSVSAISSRAYKVVTARKMKVDYHVYELEEKVPHFYERLVGEYQV